MQGVKFLNVRVKMNRSARGRGQNIHIVMKKSQRHQKELMFKFLQIQMVTYRNIYRYVYICRFVQTHVILLCQQRKLKTNKQASPWQEAHLVPRSCLPPPSSNKSYQGFLQKYLIILRLGQTIYKLSIQHLVIPESKKMPKHTYTYIQHIHTVIGSYIKGVQLLTE